MKLISACLGFCGVLCGTGLASDEWPLFRGPTSDGTTTAPHLPQRWSETENVRWKTAIPQPGWSSPVIRDNRIWVTGATTNGLDYFAYAIDGRTGRTLIEKQLFHCEAPEPLGNAVNGYASPTPVLDAKHVYVHFGCYGTACLDASTGEVLWRRTDLLCRHYRGPGSSPLLYRDRLILTFDGVDVQYVTALDAQTGKTVWRSDRTIQWQDLDANGKPKREGDFRKGFATPIVIEATGKSQLISPASSVLFSYDPDTGKELWRVANTAYTPAVSPIFADGLVLAVTGHGAVEMRAIRPNGAGDVTGTHVAWRLSGKDVPLTPSPVALDGLLYMLADHGALTCIDLPTGKVLWRELLGGSYVASLIHDGRHIYAFSNSGKTTVLRAGRTFEKLAENRLDAGFMASPAISGNDLILRTKTHLYRIGD